MSTCSIARGQKLRLFITNTAVLFTVFVHLNLPVRKIGLVLRRVFSTTSSGVSTLNTVIIVFRLIIYYTPVVLEGGLQIGFATDAVDTTDC